MSTVQEHPITIRDAAGRTLHGVLHWPTTRVHAALGVLLLSPEPRSGSDGWNAEVRLAQRVTALGVPALRLGLRNDTALRSGTHRAEYGRFVRAGGLTPTIVAAAAKFRRDAGLVRLVVAGLGDGAAAALLAGPAIEGVWGYVLVNLPVSLATENRPRARTTRPRSRTPCLTRASVVARRALGALLRPAAWRRWLAERATAPGTASLGLKARVTSQRSVAERRTRRGALRSAQHRRSARPLVTNPDVIAAWTAVRRAGQRVFFLNSSEHQPVFDRDFGAQRLPTERAAWAGLGLLVVPEAGHVFSAVHAQRALLEGVEEFVRNALAHAAAGRSPMEPDPTTDATPGRSSY